MYDPIGVVRVCTIKFQRFLVFMTKLKITERAAQSERQHCRAGERGPR